MKRPCYKQAEYAARIRRALGVDVSPVQCHVVDEPGMESVLVRSGWSKNDADGVVGFHVGNNVYVREDSDWSTLHELLHRAGINADRMNRFVAEGLVEAIASEIKRSPDEHQPTYPDETTWVKGTLLPLLGMSGVQLGKILAHSSDPPGELARRIASKNPKNDITTLRRELMPQRPGKPTLHGSRATIAPVRYDSDDGATALSAILAVAAAALGLPAVLRRLG